MVPINCFRELAQSWTCLWRLYTLEKWKINTVLMFKYAFFTAHVYVKLIHYGKIKPYKSKWYSISCILKLLNCIKNFLYLNNILIKFKFKSGTFSCYSCSSKANYICIAENLKCICRHICIQLSVLFWGVRF